jgi:tripartite-type tricarboxylate transporter receptor subunit TctC
MRKFVAACAAALGVVCLVLAPAAAQDYPTKPIHMIVPYPAGGGTDVVARIVADHVSKILGQTIYIDNRGGANGAIGLTALKQTEPDGYTIGFTADTSMTVNLYL